MAILAAAVTPDTEELFSIQNKESVGVPIIENILNVTSAKDIDGFTNVATNNYKPSNFIPIPPFLVRSVVDTIASSRRDTKSILVKMVKEIKGFYEFYTEYVKYLDQTNRKCKALVFWLHLAEVDNTTIKSVSIMTCTSENLVK